MQLIDGVEMMVDESSLTGENSPVSKSSASLTFVGGMATVDA